MRIAILDKLRGNLSLHDKYLKAFYNSYLKNSKFNENKEDNIREEEKILEKHKFSEVQELKERLIELKYNVKVINSDDDNKFYNKIKEFEPELVINVSEEKEIILLEKLSIPYTGSDLEAMILSSDKYKTKRTVKDVDSLSIAEDYLIGNIKEINNFINNVQKTKKNFIAKPNLGRGSAGICEYSIIKRELFWDANKKENIEKIKKHLNTILFDLKQPVLVEELICEGFLNDYNKENFKEVTVGLLGYENPKVLMPLEIRKKNPILTFNAKMNDEAEFIVPADIGSKLRKKLEEATIKVYKHIGSRDYLRMDLIIHKDNIYFLETNTAPGLMMNHLNNKVANSYLGIMAEKEGINLIEEIVKIAKKRYNL